MDLLPVVLLVLAAFVVVRLVHLALDPRARQNAPTPVTAVAADSSRRSA